MKIEYESMKVVKTGCILQKFGYDDLFYETCQKCEFHVDDNCVYNSHIIENRNKLPSTLKCGDDSSTPQDVYLWTYKCPYCDGNISFYSKYPKLITASDYGETSDVECEKCSTYFVLLKKEKNYCVLISPIKNESIDGLETTNKKDCG